MPFLPLPGRNAENYALSEHGRHVRASGHGVPGGFRLVVEVSLSELRVVPVGIEEGICPVGSEEVGVGLGNGQPAVVPLAG